MNEGRLAIVLAVPRVYSSKSFPFVIKELRGGGIIESTFVQKRVKQSSRRISFDCSDYGAIRVLLVLNRDEFRNILTPLGVYKSQKAGNSVFKDDIIYLGYRLEDFIMIIYSTLVHMKYLRRCL